MSDQAERLPIRLAHSWVNLYTRGLPADRRDARRAEITSDLWEHCHDGSGAATESVLGRVIAGVPADIAWWAEERGLAREGSAMDMSRYQFTIILGIAMLAVLVLWAGLSSTAAALVAGLMFLSLVGLTPGLVGSPVGTSSGKEAHMQKGIINRRRTMLLIMLAVSVIVYAGTYAYAMSLEEWGDTKATIFVTVSLVAPAVGLIALVLLVVDVVRARRS